MQAMVEIPTQLKVIPRGPHPNISIPKIWFSFEPWDFPLDVLLRMEYLKPTRPLIPFAIFDCFGDQDAFLGDDKRLSGQVRV